MLCLNAVTVTGVVFVGVNVLFLMLCLLLFIVSVFVSVVLMFVSGPAFRCYSVVLACIVWMCSCRSLCVFMVILFAVTVTVVAKCCC